VSQVSLFWKSWSRDLSLLQYSLRSSYRHWKEEGERVVAVDQECKEELERYGFYDEFPDVKWRYVTPWPDRYMHQAVVKTYADEFCKGDLLMLVDSDMIFREACSLEDFIEDGKPVIHYLPYAEKPGDPSEVWIKPTQRCIDFPLENDYMVQGPFIYWRETFLGMRNRVVEVTRTGFTDAVHSDHPFDHKKFMEHPFTFCEFNCLGLYAHRFEADRYVFQRPSETIRRCVSQLHSWEILPKELDELEDAFPAGTP
jgi:hypothetical protein